jgi:hypothetical protein
MCFCSFPLEAKPPSNFALALRPVRCAANLIKMPNPCAKTYPERGIKQPAVERSEEQSLQSLACLNPQARCAPQKPIDSRQNPARPTSLKWQADCSITCGTHTVAQSAPSRFRESIPNSLQSLFALANCWQIYRVECYPSLPPGRGAGHCLPARLLIPFRIRFS